MTGLARSLLVLLFCTLPLLTARAGETDERDDILGAAFIAFANGNFAALDSSADTYRSTAARLPSGVWKLTFVYLGISARASWDQKNPEFWQQLEDQSEQWAQQHPQSPTALLIRAIVMENHAWAIRGPDLPEDVTDEVKQQFHARLQVARNFLLAHKAVAARDPHWYVSMVRIATALRMPKQEIMSLVDAASAHKPYYYQTYFAAVDYFSPKWGGNAQTLDEFVRAVVARTRDEEGMGLYARVYWAALQSWYASSVWPAINWRDFRQGVHDVLARYPDEWNLNSFARFACAGQDRALAAELFARIEVPDEVAWDSSDDYEACRRWAAAPLATTHAQGF